MNGTRKAARARLATLTVILAIAGTGCAAYAASGLLNLVPSGQPSVTSAEVERSSLSIRTDPAVVSVAPGDSVTVAVSIQRGSRRFLIGRRGKFRIAAKVRLNLAGPLPSGASSKLRPNVTRSMASELKIRTSPGTDPGTYRLRLDAQGRLRPAVDGRIPMSYAHTFLKLKVTSPPPDVPVPGVELSGSARGSLAPGVSAPIDVQMSNTGDSPVTLGSLDTQVDRVIAPGASAALPCSQADFSLEQFTGTSQIVLPPASSVSLEDLGIPESEWPQIAMKYRSSNQDGCKLAVVKLAFTASAAATGP